MYKLHVSKKYFCSTSHHHSEIGAASDFLEEFASECFHVWYTYLYTEREGEHTRRNMLCKETACTFRNLMRH